MRPFRPRFHLKIIHLPEISNLQLYSERKNIWKLARKFPRAKMDFLGNDVNITRVAIESPNLRYQRLSNL